MKEKSNLHEEQVSKKLYNDYAEFRNKIFKNLTKNNPEIDPLILFKKAQKLLDRFLFIFFAEDKGLIPPNLISKIIKDYNKLKELDYYTPLYTVFVKYFRYIDEGYESDRMKIETYNGGLFEKDAILDNVKIDDEVLIEDSLRLSNYDFDSEVDVNILGHIFEHSLTDIEKLNAELSGEELDKKQTRRKKEGVYYTPNYITKYIVENTVGALCQEKKEKLGLLDVQVDDSCFRNAKGQEHLLNKKGNELEKKLTTYKEWLLSLKILDPACGSGAFLNQALNFLIEEHTFIQAFETELRRGQRIAFDIEQSVLENNLYGVDINEEAVEIAQLSLWLKTAHKGRKLTDLSNNIKCGNSLIDDPEVAGDKAFDWHKEFPEIMKKGGFDVVIGNPPYVQLTKHQDFYEIKYQTFPSGDLYALFIERSLSLLKSNGLFSFITPSLYIKGVRYKSLRNLILKNYDIIEIIDKGDGIFQDVKMPTAIIIIRNSNIIYQEWENFIEGYSIIKKLYVDSINLDSISLIKRGLEIGKDKTNFKQGIPIITGEDISRYNINKIRFIDEDTYRQYSKDNRYFKGPRVLIRETGNRITSLYMQAELQQNRSIYSILITEKRFSPYYIISILNSTLIQYFYITKFITKTNIFPKIRISQVKQIPIKKTTNNKQKITIRLAHIIIELINKLKINKNTFLHRLEINFDIEKFSKKLQSFYEYDFKTFLNELKKKKVKLTLTQQDEWEEYFTTYKQEILELQAQIDKTDNEIDQMVYDLYGLTDEEIAIVEESCTINN